MQVVVATEARVDVPIIDANIPTVYANSPQPPSSPPADPRTRHVTRNGDGDIYLWSSSGWQNAGPYTGGPHDYRSVYPAGCSALTVGPGPSGLPEPLPFSRTDSAPIPDEVTPHWVWIVDELDTDPVLWGPRIRYPVDPRSPEWHTEPVPPNYANDTASLVANLENVDMNGATGAECALVLCKNQGAGAAYRVNGDLVTLFTDQTVDRRRV